MAASSSTFDIRRMSFSLFDVGGIVCLWIACNFGHLVVIIKSDNDARASRVPEGCRV